MPMLSLSEAAGESGQSKSTIWRAVNSGRLPATRTYTGDYQVLHRVFSPGASDGWATTLSMKRDATDLERAEEAGADRPAVPGWRVDPQRTRQ
jgi:hypothetical protein